MLGLPRVLVGGRAAMALGVRHTGVYMLAQKLSLAFLISNMGKTNRTSCVRTLWRLDEHVCEVTSTGPHSIQMHDRASSCTIINILVYNLWCSAFPAESLNRVLCILSSNSTSKFLQQERMCCLKIKPQQTALHENCESGRTGLSPGL